MNSVFSAVAFAALTIPASADQITVLAGDLPPMFLADGQGREAEIIKKTLEKCGHEVTFEIQPFTRHWESFKSGAGDAVATVPVGMPVGGAESNVYIRYQNGVSFLTGAGTEYNGLEDLAGKKVIAFKGAGSIIPGLSEHTGSFDDYREVTDQITQSRSLFGGRVDAIIGDGMLFAEYNRQLQGQADLRFDPNQPVTFKAVFESSPYAMVFRDPQHTEDFNRCFSELDADGTIAKINTAWVDKYRDSLGESYLGY
ncbi:transporter substrate-binding domain-containing protein [Roseibium hamelinense]|nr:transporter substrate-binding domain-containing protein [Roseibium hamelinense]